MSEERSSKSKQKSTPKQEKIDALRERLYARDATTEPQKRVKLKKVQTEEVRKDWSTTPAKEQSVATKGVIHDTGMASVKKISSRPPASAPRPLPVESPEQFRAPVQSEDMPTKKKSKSYRMKFVLGGLVFFTLMLIVSGIFLMWGNNSISGENISIDVSGPFAIGGGEELSLRIAVSNQNTVAIESATLIIEYPPGTQSADGDDKEVFAERQELHVIEAGEIHNLSAKARVFGEENAEKIINVSVEYRIQGSNATFYKEAEPFRFKISSSPVVLDVDAVKSISAGQEIGITMTVNSNSPSTLSNVLVRVDYPFGFDFSSAEPAPISGNNMWRIDTLDPQAMQKITFTGILAGQQDEEKVFDISAGLPAEGDQYALASIFTTNKAEVAIEAPFLGVDVSVGGNNKDVVAIGRSQPTIVRVTFTNTLDDTIYDGGVEIALSGNALKDIDVDVEDGFYNSGTNIITFDSVSVPALKEIAPGKSSSVSFSITPDVDAQQTPEINLLVTTRGKRVFEDRVPQELIATASRTIRVTSAAGLTSAVGHTGGPVPPVAEQLTKYSVALTAQSGSNDLIGAEVTAVLPQYVAWLDEVSAGASFSYNPSTRTVSWNIGSLSSNTKTTATVQLGVTPSLSQVGTIPTIIETQRLRATDRFTDTTVRADTPALTTVIDGDNAGGRVVASE